MAPLQGRPAAGFAASGNPSRPFPAPNPVSQRQQGANAEERWYSGAAEQASYPGAVGRGAGGDRGAASHAGGVPARTLGNS